MKTNINDLRTFDALKKSLVEENVSANAITSIEKALKKGLTFRSTADLGILNLPENDIRIIADHSTFGNKPPVNIKTIQYTFEAADNKKHFFGYQFVLTYTNAESFTIAETFPIEDIGLVYVDLDINKILDGSKINYHVKTPWGDIALIGLGPTANPVDELIQVNKTSLANTTIRVEAIDVETKSNPEIVSSYQIKGKLIASFTNKLDGFQIVIMAATALNADGSPEFYPVAYATTETNGYFVTGFILLNNMADIDRIVAAKSVVSKEDKTWEASITLSTSGDEELPITRIPKRLIIVIDEKAEGDEPDCKCNTCNELNFHEKKVLEEYSYYSIVRTTEPSLIVDTIEDEEEVDLDEIYGTNYGVKVPLSVFRKYNTAANTIVKPMIFEAVTANLQPVDAIAKTTAVNPALKSLFNKDLLEKLVIDTKVNNALKGKNKRQFKGRSYLSPLYQIDWDDEPTIYQAASIAHGHLLHFKQEWLPDGYSIGDILYSLPLAPGQKKQIAVLDWERRESAANSQQLDYEETLNNTLIRDRDINEIVSATLNETIKGTSKAKTGGFGFGLGGAIMGIFNGGSYGGVAGISGGMGSASSTATNSGHRDSTANSMQSITDRTSQAASMIRSQRSTVIQTVSQGERVQATAESVANYNHCHAMTIQYFEVLRHFQVRTRLAGVQECLFVPLQISSFDLEKCQRWRSSLEKFLFKRNLLNAFDAINRLLHEKENSENYYNKIGFPLVNYAEQSMTVYMGELYIEFSFFNTNDGILNDEAFTFFKNFFNISLDQFKDRYVTSDELSEAVGPRAIEFLLNTIVIETDKNVDFKFDLSLLSRFRQNAILQISIRQSADTPLSIRRNQVNAVKIRMDKTKLNANEITQLDNFGNKYMKIRVRSGNLRYQSKSLAQTLNFAGTLFNGRIDNDLFADDDGVFINTPLSNDELRNPRGEDIDSANNLIHHLNENLEYYHKVIWMDMTPERRYLLLDGIIAPGKANGRSVASVIENKLIGIAGNSLIFPVAPGNQLDPTIDEKFNLFAQYYTDDIDPMRLSLPTKGVYAEAVMGKCNSCEEKDESRFWRWEESPIPDSPNTQILPLNTDTRRADPGDLQPKDFPAPVVNIQNAPAMPDPTGLQGMLQLIGKGDAFRDLTGLNQNQLNALSALQKSLESAQTFGKEAAELAKAAGAMKMVEEGKKSGTLKNEDANKQSNDILDKLKKDPNADRLEQTIDLIDKLKKDGKISETDANDVKKNLLKFFQDSSNSKNTLANDEIGKIADKARETNKDISITRPDGENLEVKNPSNSNTAPADADSNAITLDVVATGTLKFLPVNSTEAVDPTTEHLTIIAENGGWLPTRMKHYLTLLLGDRLVGVRTFTGLLRHLSLLPKASIRAVNVVCYTPDADELYFEKDFVYSEAANKTNPQDVADREKFSDVSAPDLVELAGIESLDLGGILVKISDVRSAFTASAEFRLFVIGEGANEQIAQTLANLLQVKVVAFTDARIRFKAEVLEGTGEDGDPAIARKILVTPRFSSGEPFEYDNFEQMIADDAAKTGRFVAQPRR